MAVRHEHRGRGPAALGEGGRARSRRVARVDDHGVRGALAGDQVAVGLVGAERQLDDVEHERRRLQRPRLRPDGGQLLGPPCFFCHRRQANVSVIVPIDQKRTNITMPLNSFTPVVMLPPSDVYVMAR